MSIPTTNSEINSLLVHANIAPLHFVKTHYVLDLKYGICVMSYFSHIKVEFTLFFGKCLEMIFNVNWC